MKRATTIIAQLIVRTTAIIIATSWTAMKRAITIEQITIIVDRNTIRGILLRVYL